MNSNIWTVILDIYPHHLKAKSKKKVIENESVYTPACFSQLFSTNRPQSHPLSVAIHAESGGQFYIHQRRTEVVLCLRRLVACVLPRKSGVLAQTPPCGICGGQSDSGRGFSANASVYRCQHSTYAEYSFIYHWRDTNFAIDSFVKQHPLWKGEKELRFQATILGTWICQKTYSNALFLAANIQSGRNDVFRFQCRIKASVQI
jgi:hypothetical protein